MHLQCGRPWFNTWVGEIPWRRDRLPPPVFMGFAGGSDAKESTCNVEDLGLIPGLGRSLGRGHGNPPQYSCLENPHGQRSLVGYSPWGHQESDMTERLSTHTHRQRGRRERDNNETTTEEWALLPESGEGGSVIRKVLVEEILELGLKDEWGFEKWAVRK